MRGYILASNAPSCQQYPSEWLLLLLPETCRAINITYGKKQIIQV